MTSRGRELPLSTYAQLAAFMVQEAMDPAGCRVPPDEALRWLDALYGLRDPSLDGVREVEAARRMVPDPATFFDLDGGGHDRR
jgi:hypothetical protein